MLQHGLLIESPFRNEVAPELDSIKYPAFTQIPSTRNISIERGWRWLREAEGITLKAELQKGFLEGRIHEDNPLHE